MTSPVVFPVAAMGGDRNFKFGIGLTLIITSPILLTTDPEWGVVHVTIFACTTLKT